MSEVQARIAARKLLGSFDVSEPEDICLRDFTGWRGLLVDEKPIHGSEGRLLTRGKRGIIAVNAHISETGKRRFVIAHELGHFELHREVDPYEMCSDRAFRDWHRNRPHEAEANQFAAELLMPKDLFGRHAGGTLPRLEVVGDLATRFRTTLMATLYRYVELDLAPCAIIYSESGTIQWSNCSDSLPFGYVPWGNEVSRDSGAGEFFAEGTTSSAPERTPVEAWFADDGLDTSVPCWEHCQPMPQYEGALSAIWVD